MKKDEYIKNVETSEENEENDESKDDYSDIDSDRPNLLQIHKKMDKLNREKDLKLMQKKRNRNKNETDIVYNAGEKKFENCFIPDLEELNNFLQNCKIKEINEKNIKEELDKIPTENIFDPNKFIEDNYGKELKEGKENKNLNINYSIEDLGFKIVNKEEKYNQEQELKESINNENKNNEKINLNEILKERDLNKQKNDIHKLIEKIKKMDIEEVLKSQKDNANKKLNIVLDLDNTCIFGFPVNKQEAVNLVLTYPKKEINFIEMEYEDKIILSALIFRNGLKEFFEYTKSFCDFFINTLGYKTYGLEIKKNLEQRYGIKFKGFKGRNNDEKRKYLYDLILESKNAVIFDDKPFVWEQDSANVIISKIFTDREINLDKLKIQNFENNTYLFLRSYSPFCYYKSSESNWQNQRMCFQELCPFFDFHRKNCFSGEYLESTKYQFIYMKEVIKIIYYLIYNSNMRVPETLKIIRYNIFYNSYFQMQFYSGDGKNILKEIIKNCGGVILDKYNQEKDFSDPKIYFVCSIEEYKQNKDEIKKEKIGMENSKVVSDKYILNSFFFMTNLENELENPQYRLDLEDDFDHY